MLKLNRIYPKLLQINKITGSLGTVPLFHEPPKDKVEIFRLPPYLSWNRYFDLFGEARQQFEALVDAGSLEVVALGMSCRLRAEILLRKDAVEYCQ